MTLRNQLNNVKIQNSETMQSYFTRVYQIKEQLETLEENVEEGDIFMTTLNGLPRSWDSLIQGICARRKLINFSRIWEECTQEETHIITREEMGATEDQALIVHTKNITKSRRITITTKGRAIITKDKRNLEEILPTFDATLVMRRDISVDIFS